MRFLIRLDDFLYQKIREIYTKVHKQRETHKDLYLSTLADREYKVLWRSSNTIQSKICYFSSYDRDSIVDDYVFHYLKELKNNKFDIIFISTSPLIRNEDIEYLNKLTFAVIHRVNFGLDFFSWKIALREFPYTDDTQRVLFANDSVYGPVYSLKPYLEKMEEQKLDMVGFTESWEMAYHVQSYFLYCKERLLRSGILKEFFSTVNVISDKMEVIRRYELGLSRVLTSKGIQIGGLIGYKELAITQSPEKNGCDFLIEKYLYNPCIGYWWKILNDRYTPFFKKSVVAFLEGDCIDFIVALSRILTKTDVILDLDFVINNLKRNN